jgi:hypothetical protein
VLLYLASSFGPVLNLRLPVPNPSITPSCFFLFNKQTQKKKKGGGEKKQQPLPRILPGTH